MAGVIFDPKEARLFINRLKGVTERLRDQERVVRGHLSTLEAVWKDEKYQAFRKSFDEILAQLAHFHKNSERYSAFLTQKAAAAEAFLGKKHY